MVEADLLAALAGAQLSPARAKDLWARAADPSSDFPLTPAIIEALATASAEPRAREAMWSELAALARARPRLAPPHRQQPSLLTLFELHRARLLAVLSPIHETEGSGDEMIELMTKSRIFGDDPDDSAAVATERIPAAVARHLERRRGLGRPERWEYIAYEAMLRWKDEHLTASGIRKPRTLADLDAAGEAFIAVFNCLHGHDIGHREVILRGLGPREIFNAVVAGEKELYRLGTSGYRDHLHPLIVEGIRTQGSLEQFLETAWPAHLTTDATDTKGRRAMVFLRVASAFGVLDSVLQTVADRDRLIAMMITALTDQSALEDNSAVLMDVLTARDPSPAAQAFKYALLAVLQDNARSHSDATRRTLFTGMLAVYQSVTGDVREPALSRDDPSAAAIFDIPYARLFSTEEASEPTHRMLVRIDTTVDDIARYATFKRRLATLGAVVQSEVHHEVMTLTSAGRRIEIYANKPSDAGLRQGLAAIATALDNRPVHTVIGRGHTSIIEPLQTDARRILGNRLPHVAMVIVGSCGAQASVRQLIGTFGYVPIVSTKATGRQVINNAIIETYISELLNLAPDATLPVDKLLDRALARFNRPGVDETLRSDAQLYQDNRTSVLVARHFDRQSGILARDPRQTARNHLSGP